MILTLIRTAKNGAIQYYTLHDRQPLLTAPFALTAAWRVGNGRERERVYGFESRADMDAALRRFFALRIKAGYSLLYSFQRQGPVFTPGEGNTDSQRRTARGS
ncbi:MAG: hypothetical protein KBB32_01230 [Spirochaetia bacterium]|nr:hypothetical protein [Spirochaetia bacterium]